MRKLVWILLMVLVATACQGQSKAMSGQIHGSSKDSEEQQPETGQQPQAYNKKVIIYNLNEDVFNKPYTEIPYYYQGDIKFLEKDVFEQYEEGHQPWLGTGIDVVTTASANLTGEENPYLNINYDNHERLTTPSGIVLEQVSNTQIKLIVPHVGIYEFELRSPPKTTILFISKITLETE